MAGLHLPAADGASLSDPDDIPGIAERMAPGGAGRLPAGIDYEPISISARNVAACFLAPMSRSQPVEIVGTPPDFGLLNPDLTALLTGWKCPLSAFRRLARWDQEHHQWSLHLRPGWQPDDGPVPGLRNYWVAVGVMAGFCQGGGVGLTMAEWMIDGEPSIDVWAMDVARFGEFATPDWGTVKSAENYERRFVMTFPNETLPKGRLQKTTALYNRLLAQGALMGQGFGLEHALWFADGPADAHEAPTFGRNRSHDYVAREVAAVQTAVGGIEIANFAKHEFRGAGARAYLEHILAGHIPRPGRLALTPMLTPKGRLYGDLTVGCLAADHFMLFGSGVMQEAHRRWFERDCPDDVCYRNVSDDWHGIALSGPKSRDLLAHITRDDVGPERSDSAICARLSSPVFR